LDKFGKPNEKTPKFWLQNYTDYSGNKWYYEQKIEIDKFLNQPPPTTTSEEKPIIKSETSTIIKSEKEIINIKKRKDENKTEISSQKKPKIEEIKDDDTSEPSLEEEN